MKPLKVFKSYKYVKPSPSRDSQQGGANAERGGANAELDGANAELDGANAEHGGANGKDQEIAPVNVMPDKKDLASCYR